MIFLNGYKDSEEIIVQLKKEHPKVVLKPGEYVAVGKYEQDNQGSNGKEHIGWLVLEVKDGKALVISQHGLVCKNYHNTSADVGWEDCDLRNWLNGQFFDETFTSKEPDSTCGG